MDDGIGTQALQSLWIHQMDRTVSFHAEDGYERLDFSSNEEKMKYAFEKTSNGFRIQ